MIKQNDASFTVHSFGIGDGVSRQFIKSTADAGRGEHYFVNKEDDMLKTDVIRATSIGWNETYEIKTIKTSENYTVNHIEHSKFLKKDHVFKFYGIFATP